MAYSKKSGWIKSKVVSGYEGAEEIEISFDRARNIISGVFDNVEFQSSKINEIMKSGTLVEHGVEYDFRPVLRRYAYSVFGNWYTAYAPSRVALIANVPGLIDEIYSIPVYRKTVEY